jgi:hypothetical protein
MVWLLRWGTCLVLVLAVAGTSAAAVKGDGLPVGNVDSGPTGVTTPGEDARLVTIPAAGSTIVARVARDGGQVLRWRSLRGNYTVPAVALDGSASGLSADGTTLALIRPRGRFPQRRTSLMILNAKSLQPQRRATVPAGHLTLRGDFSFDAISPDGGLLYLVQYLSRRDPTSYAVRAYDVRAERLLQAPIVDPREPDEQMGGFPITRSYSPDRRWAYTLYDGRQHPFIHALDTVGRTAACIDLDALTGRRDLMDLRLRLGETLDVVDRSGPVASVDMRTFRVDYPSGADAQEASAVSQAAPWVVGGLVMLLAAGALVRLRRRRRFATS